MTNVKINARKVAKLANLFITDEEEKVLDTQLESTIEHVKSLEDINTGHIVGTSEVTDLKNITREDEVKPSLSQDEAVRNAKKTYNGFFVVPVIIEEAIEG